MNLPEGLIRLEGSETKNKQGRTIPLDNELKELLRRQFVTRNIGCPHVFQRDGEQIKDFRHAWRKACNEVELTGTLFHDLRRSAIRNMVRAGVPEGVCMAISGHKTRSVFERYNIVNDQDLKDAAHRQEEYLRKRKIEQGAQKWAQ